MPVTVRFHDGPAAGQTRSYPHLSVALPRLAWTDDTGAVEAVYDRSGDGPDPDGVWLYRRAADPTSGWVSAPARRPPCLALTGRLVGRGTRRGR